MKKNRIQQSKFPSDLDLSFFDIADQKQTQKPANFISAKEIKLPSQQKKSLSPKRHRIKLSSRNIRAAHLQLLLADSRQHAAHLSEQSANERILIADRREISINQKSKVVDKREKKVNSREKALGKAEGMREEFRLQMAKLLQVNEQLVIATLKSQSLSDEVQLAKNHLSHMAYHDFLTDLPNRRLLKERLSQSMAIAQRQGKRLAVLFLDLDRFKTVNDSLGHAIGDILLQQAAERLKSSIRAIDTVSRRGGDEFVVLICDIEVEHDASVFAEKIYKSITEPYFIDENEIHIGLTIGISLFPDDGNDSETLLRNADVAMYDAKKGGRGKYHFFKKEMNYRSLERLRIEAELQLAIKNEEFELYYQAQVNLHTGDIVGIEALIRWRNSIRGLIGPSDFLSIAEECGVIVPMGRWVLMQACTQFKYWLDKGRDFKCISVNISALELEKADFFDYVQQVLTRLDLAPHSLELELTETVVMKNTKSTMVILEQLKALGVKIAIDDFGTGYSSLSYLRDFDVDTLKIDQSFVAGIKSDDQHDILLDAIIGLGKSLKLRVVAEGVVTRAQCDILISHECAVAQGYFINKPMNATDFYSLFRTSA